MAKKQSASFSSTYEGIMNDIRARHFAPVYILMGDEGYFIDSITEALASSVLTAEEREFNQFVVYGVDVTDGQIVDMAREFPMLAEYKVIIVKEAQNIRKTEELEKYLDHPSPQTVLVYCHKNGKVDSRKKFVTKAKSVGVVFESKKVSDKELTHFVTQFVAARGKTIDDRTAAMIAESIGANLLRLSSELDKLCIAMPEGEKAITPLLVEQNIGLSREYNPFELRTAVAKKNVLKAYRILDYFDKNPKSGGAFVLVPALFSYFQTLMAAWYAPDKMNSFALAPYLGMQEWQAREYVDGLRNYSGVKTMQIISKLRETDEKLKGLHSPNTPPTELVKELLFFIFN